MASITTAVPSGLITTDWCIQNSVDWDNQPSTCANATIGQKDADFETICCNGDIIDVAKNLFTYPRPNNQTRYIDLEDMVCCGVHGAQAGGIGPALNLATACTMGQPTPLVSLAATNVDNAALYAVTYTSASFGSTTTGDFIPTTMPSCLWVYTKTGVALRNVTVPAARITSLPSGATPGFGDDSYPTSTADSNAAYSSYWSSLSADSAATATATATATTSVSSYAGTMQPCVGAMSAMLMLCVLRALLPWI